MLWHGLQGAGGLGGGGASFALADFSYTGNSVTLGTSGLYGLDISADGLSLVSAKYSASGRIYKYPISLAWDLSTASGTSTQTMVVVRPVSAHWADDGSYVYYGDFINDRVIGKPLATAWDLSTAGTADIYYTTGQGAQPYDVGFSPDGLTMYVRLGSEVQTFQYTLSTAWDVTTASYAGKAAAVGPYFDFSLDGTQLISANNNSLDLHNLSTAWDISTAGAVAETLDLSVWATTIRGVALGNFDTSLYIYDQTSGIVRQYSR